MHHPHSVFHHRPCQDLNYRPAHRHQYPTILLDPGGRHQQRHQRHQNQRPLAQGLLCLGRYHIHPRSRRDHHLAVRDLHPTGNYRYRYGSDRRQYQKQNRIGIFPSNGYRLYPLRSWIFFLNQLTLHLPAQEEMPALPGFHLHILPCHRDQ